MSEPTSLSSVPLGEDADRTDTADTAALLERLRAVLGADQVMSHAQLQGRRMADWSGTGGLTPRMLLRPRHTEDVSRALAVCHELGQAVVVQGGLTGLAGSANIRGNEIAMTLERMQAIEEIDVTSGTLTVQAGAILQHVQEAAERAGLMFPLDLGARGSCTIGGNLATNAGGNRVIKYGMMREQVLGLEAVLSDGTVLSDLHKMIKNNAGYDLKQLLIGSEGTLAVITRAVLRLRPKPIAVATAWCGLPDFAAVTRLLATAQGRLSGGVSAFEVMWPSYYDFVLDKVAGLRAPLQSRHAFYVLLESVGTDVERHAEEFEAMLATLLDEGVVDDAALAQSASAALAFWAIRDAPAEFPVFMPDLVGFDISFAISDIGVVAEQCERLLHDQWPDATVLVYGHLGDGNLHLIVNVPGSDHATRKAVDAAVYNLTRTWNGSVSAEHGVGDKKLTYLAHTRDAGARTAMARVKRGLDPLNLLNPGKVLTGA
jgi:FAD/FMN-containing dehydrogenase